MKQVKTLVYLLDNFQDLEFVGSVGYMRSSQVFDLVYANGREEPNTVVGQWGLLKLEATPTKDLNLEEFDALLVVGGRHCQSLRDDEAFFRTTRYFFKNKKLVLAICDAANVFYEKKLMDPFAVYTAYPTGNHSKFYRPEPLIYDAEVNLLSAKDPQAAYAFGQAAIKLGKKILAKK